MQHCLSIFTVKSEIFASSSSSISRITPPLYSGCRNLIPRVCVGRSSARKDGTSTLRPLWNFFKRLNCYTRTLCKQNKPHYLCKKKENESKLKTDFVSKNIYNKFIFNFYDVYKIYIYSSLKVNRVKIFESVLLRLRVRLIGKYRAHHHHRPESEWVINRRWNCACWRLVVVWAS